jgi:hypothetical protein
MADLEPRVAVLEQIARDTRDMLARMEGRFDRIETRLDRVEARQGEDFRFLVRLIITQGVLMIGGFAAVLGVIARAQHWV